MYSEDDNYDDNNYNDNNQGGGNKLRDFYESNKKLIIVLGALIVLFLLLSLFKGCSNSTIQGGGTVTANDLKLSSNEENISIGNSTKIIATVENVNNPTITWSSSDTSIASVDENGRVIAISSGFSTITATYVDGNNNKSSVTCDINVSEGKKDVYVESIKLPDGELLISEGDTYQLTKEVNPSNGYISNTLYTSSDESVAKVTNNGKVTAIKEGTATISISVNDGNFKDDIVVNVTNDDVQPIIIVKPEQISFTNETKSIAIDEKFQLVYSVVPLDSYTKDITWESSNESVATVSKEGIVTGISKGNAFITAKTTNNLSATVTIEIVDKKVNVTSISLNSSSSLTMQTGNTEQIVPNIEPSNATDKTVTYASSNSSVAYVDNNGIVTAITVGTAEITIKTNDGDKTAKVFANVISNNNNNNNNNITYDDSNNSNNNNTDNSYSDNSCSSSMIDFTNQTNTSGALSTNVGGNANTFAGTSIILKTAGISSKLSNVKYCYNANTTSACYNYVAANDKITIPVSTLAAKTGYLHLNVKGTCSDGGSVNKNYYIKYTSGNINTASACYYCSNEQRYYWGTAQTNCTKSSYTETKCKELAGSTATTTSSACYYCTSSKTYIWSNSQPSGCTKLTSYTTQSSCNNANGSATSQKLTTTSSFVSKGPKYWEDYLYYNKIILRSTSKKINIINYCVTNANEQTCTISKSSVSGAYNVTKTYLGVQYYVLSRSKTYAVLALSATTRTFRFGAWGSQRICFQAKYTDNTWSDRVCSSIKKS